MAPCRETLGFRPTIITNASLVSFQVWSQEYFQLWYFSPKKNYYQVFCFVLRWGFWDYFFLFVLFYLSVAEGHKESSAVLCSQKNQITLKNLVTLVFTPSQIPPFSVDLCGSADDLLPPWKPVYFCLPPPILELDIHWKEDCPLLGGCQYIDDAWHPFIMPHGLLPILLSLNTCQLIHNL